MGIAVGDPNQPPESALLYRCRPDPDFTDAGQIDAELRRVFDICHGCRRCFNLCDAFPTLFGLIDESETGELVSVDSAGFKKVVDACTLCDMCFMVSCPYVPPHEFDLDFPHLILRARAAEVRRAAFLAKLGGVEETAFLRLGGETVQGVPEADVDRTSAQDKASTVQFIHFPFSDEQAEAFRRPGAEVVVGFGHPQYGHMAVLPEAVRQALAGDFD